MLARKLIMGSVNGPTVYVHDTFPAADNTEMNGRAASPVAGAGNWITRLMSGSASNGIYKITSNGLQQANTSNAEKVCMIDSGHADGVLTTDILFFNGIYPGLAFRYNGTDYLFAIINSSKVEIYRYNGGTYPLLASSAAGSFTQGLLYNMVATLNGNSISVSCNGVTANGTSTVNQTSTSHGFRAFNYTASVMADNFKMTALTA